VANCSETSPFSLYLKHLFSSLLLWHCFQLHAASVSLASPMICSQQQFDTYEEDPYWKRNAHLQTTELMGGTIHTAGCFLGQESCHMVELHASATDTTKRTGKVVRYTFYLRYKMGTHIWNKFLEWKDLIKEVGIQGLSKYRDYGLVSISRYYSQDRLAFVSNFMALFGNFSSQTGQQIIYLAWNLNFRYCIHKNPPLDYPMSSTSRRIF
jgi:hypothetical protein